MECGSRQHSINFLKDKIEKLERQVIDLKGFLKYLELTKDKLENVEHAESALWNLLTQLRSY